MNYLCAGDICEDWNHHECRVILREITREIT